MVDYKRQELYFEKHLTTFAGKVLLPSFASQVFSTAPLKDHSTKLSKRSLPNAVCKISKSTFSFSSEISFTSSSSIPNCETRVCERQIARRGVHPGKGNSSSRMLSWLSREPEARESTRGATKDSERVVGL